MGEEEMNAWIEWNGNSLPGSFKIKSGEPITLCATTDVYTTIHARFIVTNSANQVVLDQTIQWYGWLNKFAIDWITPQTEGVYKLQVVGGWQESDRSNIITLDIDNSAVEPTSVGWEGTLLTALKWVAAIAVIGTVGYVVVKTGLFDAGTSAVKRKLEYRKV